MKHQITRAAALTCAILMLSACSSISLWPFGGGPEADPTRAPAGATAFQCDGSKHFFVRYLDNGAAAWVMLPEREFRLNKVSADSGSRYSNGSDALDITGGTATLWDGDAATHSNCKPAAG